MVSCHDLNIALRLTTKKFSNISFSECSFRLDLPKFEVIYISIKLS